METGLLVILLSCLSATYCVLADSEGAADNSERQKMPALIRILRRKRFDFGMFACGSNCHRTFECRSDYDCKRQGKNTCVYNCCTGLRCVTRWKKNDDGLLVNNGTNDTVGNSDNDGFPVYNTTDSTKDSSDYDGLPVNNTTDGTKDSSDNDGLPVYNTTDGTKDSSDNDGLYNSTDGTGGSSDTDGLTDGSSDNDSLPEQLDDNIHVVYDDNGDSKDDVVHGDTSDSDEIENHHVHKDNRTTHSIQEELVG